MDAMQVQMLCNTAVWQPEKLSPELRAMAEKEQTWVDLDNTPIEDLSEQQWALLNALGMERTAASSSAKEPRSASSQANASSAASTSRSAEPETAEPSQSSESPQEKETSQPEESTPSEGLPQGRSTNS